MIADPFAVLGVERRYDVDLAAVERVHRELSRALHPDRYASAGPSERHAALGRAVEVNDAWRVLRDPVRRAEALFALGGVAVGEDREPKASPAFLMEVLEEREALAEARARRDAPAIAKLAAQVEARVQSVEALLAETFRGEAKADALMGVLPRLGELRFYRRFLEEVTAAEDDL